LAASSGLEDRRNETMVNEKVTGKIQSINPRQVNTATGPATVNDITINDIVISTFKPDGKPGDTVEIEFYTKNGYRNAVNIKVVEVATGQTVMPQFGAGPTKFVMSDRIEIGYMIGLAIQEKARLADKSVLTSEDVAKMCALFKKVHIEQQ
jgi:hypothetical protein